jgi:hypothetical protein
LRRISPVTSGKVNLAKRATAKKKGNTDIVAVMVLSQDPKGQVYMHIIRKHKSQSPATIVPRMPDETSYSTLD